MIRTFFALLPLIATACFNEEVCAEGATRISGRCVLPDSGSAPRDTGPTDAGPDTSVPPLDASPDSRPPCAPTPEVCNDTDDDCDERVDESVTRPCTDGIETGECTAGIEICTRGVWGTCEGRIDPSTEFCDGDDDDCNGLDDDGATCDLTDSVNDTRCEGGTCRVNSCLALRGDCDGDYANGCEVDLSEATDDCGRCGTSCAWGCSASRCLIPWQVRAGEAHSCVVLASLHVACWGANDAGQLGNGTTTASLVPTYVVGVDGTGRLEGIVDIALGARFSCARRLADDAVFCWGANNQGQLGDGSTMIRLVPTPVVGVGGTGTLGAFRITAGSEHACAVFRDGTAACWGSNSSGQIGADTFTPTFPIPTPVADSDGTGSLTGIASLGAGLNHTCAIVTGGAVRCWGNNARGQVGDGTTASRRRPTAVLDFDGVGELSGVLDIDGGFAHTCARLSSGGAGCWGLNDTGQLGNGMTDSPVPLRVVGVGGAGLLTGVGALEVLDGHHSCVRLTDGTLACWGDNASGQLGTGDMLDRAVPTLVTGPDGSMPVTRSRSVGSGFFHTCAVANETVVCWGLGSNGQIGDGGRISRLIATVVSSGSI